MPAKPNTPNNCELDWSRSGTRQGQKLDCKRWTSLLLATKGWIAYCRRSLISMSALFVMLFIFSFTVYVNSRRLVV